jgi:hypothetical protein
LAATLKTPTGLYRLVAFPMRERWNCAVFGPGDFRQYGLASNAAIPMSDEQASGLLYDF